ncbi:hypothetical protein PAPYR_3103 [Paratrimastix pyriformis]|uniref:FERM domain-containing protein n=1 Tax=Paratrimastix pyriformis TaxID=342808 RepID=A0ABQ8UT07_9EUKA|nr:hypothetical protein PAPYR_3103 [Paratrimastix pyriformis]|eukprot:GAFH01002124.1.p1 GENE.GAFH01002124.1~~GAFH01002124.1.p1  ORF type:complete len:353 (+),score=85.39 GAFH01002124.1:53-1111(+)
MSFVAVHFEDGSEKKFAVAEDTLISQLIQKVATKLDIRQDIESFSIFESIDGQEHCLKPTERCIPKQGATLVFKKRYFFAKHPEDETLVHLQYIQLREDVLRGNYCLTDTEACKLGAIAMHEAYGRPDMQKHRAGFLVKSNQLTRFVPQLSFKNRKPEEWEKMLLAEYHQWSPDLQPKTLPTPHHAKLEYMEQLEAMKPNLYGSTFFYGWELVVENQLVKERIKVTIAISKFGIVTFRHTSKTHREVLHSHSFQEIAGWAINPAFMTFVYTIPAADPAAPPDRFTFESSAAEEITPLCETLAHLIMQSMQAAATPAAEAPATAAAVAEVAAPAPAVAAPAPEAAPAPAAPSS